VAKLAVKASARFKAFTPAMLYILQVVYLEARECTSVENIVITSVNDSGHSTHSRHYTDEAIDIRTRNFPKSVDRQRFQTALRRALGKPFTVLFEGGGTPNQHIHIQPRKGSMYAGPLAPVGSICHGVKGDE
jgi:hypothetical protein|tara:strand:- start:1010 stop:1405 length:396 start_codon:yes stop_codon:yes gene_type:complete